MLQLKKKIELIYLTCMINFINNRFTCLTEILFLVDINGRFHHGYHRKGEPLDSCSSRGMHMFSSSSSSL